LTVTLYLAVMGGAVMGAPARYLVEHAVYRCMPGNTVWAIMGVNVSGSLLFGLLSGLALHHHVGPVALALVGTGFCGAYTTFSAFTLETWLLVEEGRRLKAALNVVGTVVVGLLGAGAGVALGLA